MFTQFLPHSRTRRLATVLLGYAWLMSAPMVSHAAEQSQITDAEGVACMGIEFSQRETQQMALEEAKRQAVEFTSTRVSSTTVVKNFALEEDLVEAFANAKVKILEKLTEDWDDSRCYSISVRVEVTPLEEKMEKVSQAANFIEDPTAPLTVKVWTSKKSYAYGELMKIYVQGNKPFYGRLIYVDASGNNYQILPNPYRSKNYFNGGTIYEYPTPQDNFELEVSEPFGKEKIVFYASTSELGALQTNNLGPILEIKDGSADIARKTRGIKLKKKGPAVIGQPAPQREFAEFAEAVTELTTHPVGGGNSSAED